MKRLLTLFCLMQLCYVMATAQNYLHILQADSVVAVPIAKLDSVTVRDAAFYDKQCSLEVFNGKCYAGVVADAWGREFAFNLMLVMGEGSTMYIYNLDPFFAQNGCVAEAGYNIFQGEAVAAADGKSVTLSCAPNQPMGYQDVVIVSVDDPFVESLEGTPTHPIVFTITEETITCDTGYAMYTPSEGGFYTAFRTFTLNGAEATSAPRKTQQVGEGVASQQQLKMIPMRLASKQKGKASHQLMPMDTREITE